MDSFFEMVRSVFSFLEMDHGFKRELVQNGLVQFARGDLFIRLAYYPDHMSEVSLSVGAFSRHRSRQYGLGVLAHLKPPGLGGYDPVAYSAAEVRAALVELADQFRFYGQRVLAGDVSVIDEMQRRNWPGDPPGNVTKVLCP